MSTLAIRIENLSKQYRIGPRQQGYKTLRESLVRVLSSPFRRLHFNSQPEIGDSDSEYFWALKDVSFGVKQGAVIGIIGRNGAGKSTLLKILSQITKPTEGRAVVNGRVGSLLEVGTGFHPELTGRENVYLNGAILGMRKSEIERKFDEMVAFAEVEKFIDTPVKHYSSGMYVRLAFSVAAHLEPEILLVDEVLAVGDAVFQTKCLARMRQITSKGRTVLFVSHNLAAVSSISERAIVLDAGRVLFNGPVSEAVDFYERELFAKKYMGTPVGQREDRTGSGDIRLTGFRLEDEDGRSVDRLFNGRAARLVFSYRTRRGGAKNVDFGIIVERDTGEKVFQHCTRFSGQNFESLSGEGNVVFTVKRLPLVPGRYRIGTYILAESSPADFMDSLAGFDVADGDFYGSGYLVFQKETPILVDGGWTREPLS